MNELQLKVWAILSSGRMSGEDVARCLTDYHGNQLLDEGFAQHLVDEGFCDPSNVGLEDE